MASVWSKIRGTFETIFQLGKGGPQVKANSGAVELRNSTDAAFVIGRGADPVGDDDFVTKRYGDANYGGGGPGPGGTSLTVTLTNNESVTMPIGTPAYVNAEAGAKNAQANTALTKAVVGLATTAVLAGASGTFQTAGPMTLTTAQWDAITGDTGGLLYGATYYLDGRTAGKLTRTPPSGYGYYVRPVGVAVSSTILNINVAARDVLLAG